MVAVTPEEERHPLMRWPQWYAVLLLMLLVSGLTPGVLRAQELRPAWEVGQRQVSPADLAVIVPQPAPQTLALDDALQLALRQNGSFRRSVQSLLAARSDYAVARQRWDLEAFGQIEKTGNGEATTTTRFGGTLSYAAVTGADFSITTELERLDTEEEHTQSVTATLRQPLLAGAGPASAAYEAVRQARNSYRASLLTFFADRQDLIEQVISSYYGVIEQQKLVEVQQASVELARKSVSDAEIRLKEGTTVEIELTRAKFRLSSQQASAVNRLQSYQDAMDRFLLLLGLEMGATSELVTAAPYEPETLDVTALTKQALELRPDLMLADLSLEDRQAVLRLARSNRRPSLDLFGGWTRTENGTEDTSWNAGLELSVPIASRSLLENVRQAQWSYLVAEHARRQLTQEVIADVRRQARAAEAAKANVDIAAQGLATATRSLEIAQRMEEEGLGTNRDTLDAIDEKLQSETQLISSKIDYYLSLVRLKVAIGEPIMGTLAPAPATPAPIEAPAVVTPGKP